MKTDFVLTYNDTEENRKKAKVMNSIVIYISI